MKELQRILSYARRACEDYNMIGDGDRIAVGISGGKDSMTLLTALAEMRRFYPKKYEVAGITVDSGFKDMDFSPVSEYCRKLGVEYKIIPTDIAKIVFDIRKEPNPCSLCAKMRRGVLHTAAKDLGCNKIALGHHFDDVVDTFMLNLFFEGRLGCFSPVTYLSRADLHLIRPLLYAKEKTVSYFVKSNPEIPVIDSCCPENHNTERENMKNLLKELERNNKGLTYRIFGAICRGGIDGFRTASGKIDFE